MLTHDDIKLFRERFDVREHEFHKGFTYITEHALCKRIEAVDPSYEFRVLDISLRGQQVIVRASLTISGVTRENIGMNYIEKQAKNPERDAGEAEKAAATDALKRCARLFGIGQYILELPDYVTDTQSLAKFFGSAQKQQPAPPPPATDSNGNGTQEARLTEADAAKIKARADELNLNSGAVLTALGVNRLGEYAGTLASALKKLDVYASENVPF